MLDFLHTLVIYPIVQIIDVVFIGCARIFHSTGFSIIGSSCAVTVLTLPLYFTAEKIQKREKDLQKLLAPRIAKIKQVFKGDEQYMMLSTYYRQNHYHPVYALRSTFGLLIQIPFFIAAYSYLAHLHSLQGARFLWFSDLSRPDALISADGLTFNILPVLMTAINGISGALYTKGSDIKDKIQVYGMAAVFLILLYNSPSGLVLYWTMNNIFSLVKNIVQKTGRAKRIVYCALLLFTGYTWYYFLQRGFSPKRLCVLLLLTLPLFIPPAQKLFCLLKAIIKRRCQIELSAASDSKTFIFSAVILFLLAGLTIPSLLISSSVQEFSFIENYTSPLPFIGNVCMQAAGIFLFWFICLFFIFPQNIRRILAVCASLIMIFALFDAFVFPGDFGFLSTTFFFSRPDTLESQYRLILISGGCFIPVLFLFLYLLLSRRKILLLSFQAIIITALSVLSIYSMIRIQSDFTDFARRQSEEKTNDDVLSPVYTLSETEKNVVIIMLDRAISGYFPYILEEAPELSDIFTGFVYYPNCVSFGGHTRIGAPPLFGGYEYTPELIHKNRSTALKFHNEALFVLPRIFSNEGWRVTVTDPSFANYSLVPDLSIYKPFPEIHAENITGKYAGRWLKEHPEVKAVSVSNLLENLLIRFSVFKMALPVFRIFIYDKGDWLADNICAGSRSSGFSTDAINCWTTLDVLPEITQTSPQKENRFIAMVNDLPHHPAFFDLTGYIPSGNKTTATGGGGVFADDDNYHVNIVSYIELGKWFEWMKSKNVYDNTRIIIASDHGSPVLIPSLKEIILPDGENVTSYNSVLLVKDFNAQGALQTDAAFMTQADVPLLAVKDLVDNPVNPWSNKKLANDKENGVKITTASVLKFTIGTNEWLHVKDNIFISDNWKKAEQ